MNLRAWLRRTGWPYYPCEQCVGQEPWQGCYCAYHDAYAPCSPDMPRKAALARWLWRKLYGQRA